MAHPLTTDQNRPLTVQEFERLPEEDLYKLELVRGWVVREPRPKWAHARVSVILSHLLNDFVETHDLGVVLGDAGFILSEAPPTVRGPDLSFVRKERIPPPRLRKGFARRSPDLAVEILSPSNRRAQIQEKITQYLDAGASAVWIVDPRRRTVAIHHPSGDVRLLTGDDILDGGDVLPGFRLALPKLFDI